jgi:hypothetical protein
MRLVPSRVGLCLQKGVKIQPREGKPARAPLPSREGQGGSFDVSSVR